jgi:hypothetical protein
MHTSDERPRPASVPETDVIGRIATPRRLALAGLPCLGLVATPLLPFATTPTSWFGLPAVLVWMALLIFLTVAVLQVIDRGISRQAARARREGGVAS